MSTYSFDTDLVRDDGEIPVTVTYSVSPSYPATRYQPAEGGEIEILHVRYGKEEIVLTTDEENAMLELIEERCGDDAADEAAAHDDYLYDQWRDEQMMNGFDNGQD